MPNEQQLSSVLSEFARTLVTDFPIQGILDHLVERIVDVMPIPDLREHSVPELRPPGPGGGARRGVHVPPLRHGDMQLGALDLYRDAPGPLDADTMDAARRWPTSRPPTCSTRERGRISETRRSAPWSGALHDALTGLPNRILLLERLDQAVRRGHRSGNRAAVLFADLDRFKQVNDLYGHGIGDELLVAVAQRLTVALRPGDTLARMSAMSSSSCART